MPKSKLCSSGLPFNIAILCMGFAGCASAAGDAPLKEIYSNVAIHPASSDCGGFRLTLTPDRAGFVIEGFLQAYEGNCDSEKTEIHGTRSSKRGGTLRFVSAACAQGEQPSQCAQWQFAGIWSQREVAGQISHCYEKRCTDAEHIRLKRLKPTTRED